MNDKRRDELILFFKNHFGLDISKNVDIFHSSLLHSSIKKNDKISVFERLEFLGDSMLNAVLSEMLYSKYDQIDEGNLTKRKSNAVNRRTLNFIAEKINITEVLIYKDILDVRAYKKLKGSALESVFGAVFLTFGYQQLKDSIDNLFHKHYFNTKIERQLNYKQEVIEWCSKNKHKIQFKILKQTKKQKYMALILNKEEMYRTKAHSKKEGEFFLCRKLVNDIIKNNNL